MTLCRGLAPPPKGRTNAHAQRCAGTPEPGIDYCAAHAKVRGLVRCRKCGRWKQPLGLNPHHDRPYVIYEVSEGVWECVEPCQP